MKGQLKLLGGQKIKSPNSLDTRPTTSLAREALINILGNRILNSSWLDLFSGSGVVGCEVLQKGAKVVVAIESNRKAFKICESNLLKIASSSQKEILVKVEEM